MYKIKYIYWIVEEEMVLNQTLNILTIPFKMGYQNVAGSRDCIWKPIIYICI